MSRPKAVVVYLARSTQQDAADLSRSLKLLKKNFLNRFRYPVVVFIEPSFKGEWKNEVLRNSGVDCRFETIEFSVPSFLNAQAIPEYVFHPKFTLGYRHMCRFFSGAMYLEPALKDYQWYWRLDTDSFVLGKVKYDVFEFMQKNGCIYGYNVMSKDEPAVSVGLWELTRRYIKDRSIRPTYLNEFIQDGEWDRSYYYTNFEISSMDFWRSQPVKDYFDYVDRSGGIYRYRWGDTLIHTMALGMFLDKSKTHRFTDIYYDHQGEFNVPEDRWVHFKLFCRKVRQKLMNVFWAAPNAFGRRCLDRIESILFPPPPDTFFKKVGRNLRKIGLKRS